MGKPLTANVDTAVPATRRQKMSNALIRMLLSPMRLQGKQKNNCALMRIKKPCEQWRCEEATQLIPGCVRQ
jgi:hypothetical protein